MAQYAMKLYHVDIDLNIHLPRDEEYENFLPMANDVFWAAVFLINADPYR